MSISDSASGKSITVNFDYMISMLSSPEFWKILAIVLFFAIAAYALLKRR